MRGTSSGIALDEDLKLHKTGWIIQRVGWTVMYLFLLLAVLRFFGEGVLSNKKISSGNIAIEYERYGRYEHGQELEIRSALHVQSVTLSQEYLSRFKISGIVPEPSRQLAGDGIIQYLFEGSSNQHVVIYMDPKEKGTIQTRISVNNTPFIIKQTIYP